MESIQGSKAGSNSDYDAERNRYEEEAEMFGQSKLSI